jgi:hypothetical protein
LAGSKHPVVPNLDPADADDADDKSSSDTSTERHHPIDLYLTEMTSAEKQVYDSCMSHPEGTRMDWDNFAGPQGRYMVQIGETREFLLGRSSIPQDIRHDHPKLTAGKTCVEVQNMCGAVCRVGLTLE